MSDHPKIPPRLNAPLAGPVLATPLKALETCRVCGSPVSRDAKACPKCGQPGRRAAAKSKDLKQNFGCLILVAGVVVFFLFPPVGVALFVLGGLIALVNTRVGL